MHVGATEAAGNKTHHPQNSLRACRCYPNNSPRQRPPSSPYSPPPIAVADQHLVPIVREGVVHGVVRHQPAAPPRPQAGRKVRIVHNVRVVGHARHAVARSGEEGRVRGADIGEGARGAGGRALAPATAWRGGNKLGKPKIGLWSKCGATIPKGN